MTYFLYVLCSSLPLPYHPLFPILGLSTAPNPSVTWPSSTTAWWNFSGTTGCFSPLFSFSPHNGSALKRAVIFYRKTKRMRLRALLARGASFFLCMSSYSQLFGLVVSSRVKESTDRFMTRAWLDSSSLAAALCSEVAELV